MKLMQRSIVCLGLVLMMGIGSAEAACKKKLAQPLKAAVSSSVEEGEEISEQLRQCALAAVKSRKKSKKAILKKLRACVEAYGPGGSCE